jgi:hypothetical protein
MLEGETADVIILSRPVMDELQKQDKFARGSVANIRYTSRVGGTCRRTETGHQHGRCAKAHAASRQINCLCGPGKR